MSLLSKAAFLIVCLGFLAGCAGYEPLEADSRTGIYLAPVLNESPVPQVIAPLTRNLREQISHSAAWRLVGEDEADVVLQITVETYDRDTLARDPADTGRPLSYRNTMGVRIDWDSDRPAPWGSNESVRVESDLTVYGQPGLIRSESNAVSEMADDLARKIMDRLNWPALGAD